MFKNILITGPGRAGKTTLSKLINKKFGYSINSIDEVITALGSIPEFGINYKTDSSIVSKKMSPFIIKFIEELSEGNKFYDNCKTVIEGTDIDLDLVLPHIDQSKTLIIGLTYNTLNEKELYQKIKKYDTEDDWTYWCNEEELRDYCRKFIERNKYFNEKFEQYNILSFDTSNNREEVLNNILSSLEDLTKWEEKHK